MTSGKSFQPALFVVASLILGALGATNVKAGDMASSSILANTCFSCHGTDGASQGAMPSIKGKPAKYIETVLMAYREDKREGTIMNRIAKGFTADEIKALSRYFASK